MVSFEALTEEHFNVFHYNQELRKKLCNQRKKMKLVEADNKWIKEEA